jgi:hypothetical protein
VLLDLLGRRVVTNGVPETEEELECLLVGKTVERAGKTGKSGRVGEEGIRESRADEVWSSSKTRQL